MAETPWTPGPWEWEFVENGRALLVHTVETPQGLRGSETIIYHKAPDIAFWFEDGPNARLIAAAPEMAELLERFTREGAWAKGRPGVDPPEGTTPEARALLARIRGESE